MTHQLCDAEFSWCPADVQAGAFHKLRVEDLSPTEFAVDDIDYSAGKTLRTIHELLKEKGIRLVIAQVLDDVKEERRHALRKVFGKKAYYDTLEDVLNAYRRHTGAEEK